MIFGSSQWTSLNGPRPFFRMVSGSWRLVAGIVACIILLFIGSAVAQIPTSGLVAYYTLDGNANDVTGLGHSGSIVNALATSDRYAQPNGALAFNGSSAYVEVPDSNDLDLTGAFTLSAWILWNGAESAIVSKARPCFGTSYGILIGADGHVSVAINNDANQSGGTHNLEIKSSISTGQWHFVSGVFDGGSLRLYVDGAICGSGTWAWGSLLNSGYPLYIGRGLTFAYDTYHSGKIDDVSIYNRALSSDEVKNLYSFYLFSSPNGLFATDGTLANKIAVTWSTSTNATSYCVWRAATNNFALASFVTNVVSTGFVDTGVTPGVTNWYWVQAVWLASATGGLSQAESGWAAQGVKLVIDGTPSRIGTPSPDGYGTNTVIKGGMTTNGVPSFVVVTNSVRDTCIGYSGTGSVPNGLSNVVIYTANLDSTLTWLWRREYLLDVSNVVGGVVSGANWYATNSVATVSATASNGWMFLQWLGDVPDGASKCNPLGVPMGIPRSISPEFISFTQDSDGDGLTDYDEIYVYGTDRTKKDTDGDGMPDGWEVAHGLNPLVNDAAGDLDLDGVSNLEEFQHGLDPTKACTYGDGTNDYRRLYGKEYSNFVYDRTDRLVGAEYSRGSNGLSIAYVYDGNGDIVRQVYMDRVSVSNCLPNLWKFQNGLSLDADPYADPDGDGWTNYQEWQNGTDPKDQNSCPNAFGFTGSIVGAVSSSVYTSRYSMAIGQLDNSGADDIVVGGDGVSDGTSNNLLVLSQTFSGWATQTVAIGSFGVTSIAVGQATNRPAPAIYLGLRCSNSGGEVRELIYNGNSWTQTTIATSSNGAAFVLGVQNGNAVVAQLSGNQGYELALYGLTYMDNVWQQTLLDSQAAHRGVGDVVSDAVISSGRVVRLLDSHALQVRSPCVGKGIDEFNDASIDTSIWTTNYIAGWPADLASYWHPSVTEGNGMLQFSISGLSGSESGSGSSIALASNIWKQAFDAITISILTMHADCNAGPFPGGSSSASIAYGGVTAYVVGSGVPSSYGSFSLTETNIAITLVRLGSHILCRESSGSSGWSTWSEISQDAAGSLLLCSQCTLTTRGYSGSSSMSIDYIRRMPVNEASKSLGSGDFINASGTVCYQEQTGKWFVKRGVISDWQSAEIYARSMDCTLAAVAGTNCNSWLAGKFPGSWWIGLNRESDTDAWKWVSGECVNYTNWDSGTYLGAGKRFAYMESDSHLWAMSDTSLVLDAVLQSSGVPGYYQNMYIPQPEQTADVVCAGKLFAAGHVRSTEPEKWSLFHAFVSGRTGTGSIGSGNSFVLAEYMIDSSNNWTACAVTNAPLISIRGAVNFGMTCIEATNGLQTLFTAEPDGNVYYWTATNSACVLERHMFSREFHDMQWHQLAGYRGVDSQQGLVGLLADPANPQICQVVFWPPKTDLQPPVVVGQTPPTTLIMSEPNAGIVRAEVGIRIWDAEGNASKVELQFQCPGSNSWFSASLLQVDGVPLGGVMPYVMAMPTGCTHRVLWDCRADLGARFFGNVLVRARARDNSDVGDWSLPVPYLVTVLPEYTVTASCGMHGSIEPHGDVAILEGKGTNFVIEAESAYHVASVLIDGVAADCAGLGTATAALTLTNVTSNHMIRAEFALDKHALTIVSDYGSPAPTVGAHVYDVGTSVTNRVDAQVPAGSARYDCAGWRLEGCEPVSGLSNQVVVAVTNDATLTWLWATNYALSFATSGPGTLNLTSGWYRAGQTLALTAYPEQEAVLAGWLGDTAGCVENGNSLQVPVDQPRSITATFSRDMRLLVVTSKHGMAVPAEGQHAYPWSTPVTCAITNSVVFDAPGTARYTCTGWQGTGNATNGVGTNTSFTLTSPTGVTWQWQTNYWQEIVVEGVGSVSATNAWYGEGDTAILIASAGANYHFDCWAGDTNGCIVAGTALIAPMSEARRVTAVFSGNLHSLSVFSEQGRCLPDAGVHSLPYGQGMSCAVTNSPFVIGGSTQMVCTGWSGVGSVPASGVSTNTGAFTLTGDSAIFWLWRKEYLLTVQLSGQGALSVSNAWVAEGSVMTVQATPQPYHTMFGWSGDIEGCPVNGTQLTAVMDRPRSIQAVFVQTKAPKGTPEAWLARFGLTNSASALEELADADGDGFPAWQEYLADTDPTNRDSRLELTDVRLMPGGVQIGWKGGVWASQWLEARYSLSDTGEQWVAIFSNQPPTSTSTNVVDTGATNGVRFYRIRANR